MQNQCKWKIYISVLAHLGLHTTCPLTIQPWPLICCSCCWYEFCHGRKSRFFKTFFLTGQGNDNNPFSEWKGWFYETSPRSLWSSPVDWTRIQIAFAMCAASLWSYAAPTSFVYSVTTAKSIMPSVKERKRKKEKVLEFILTIRKNIKPRHI